MFTLIMTSRRKWPPVETPSAAFSHSISRLSVLSPLLPLLIVTIWRLEYKSIQLQVKFKKKKKDKEIHSWQLCFHMLHHSTAARPVSIRCGQFPVRSCEFCTMTQLCPNTPSFYWSSNLQKKKVAWLENKFILSVVQNSQGSSLTVLQGLNRASVSRQTDMKLIKPKYTEGDTYCTVFSLLAC